MTDTILLSKTEKRIKKFVSKNFSTLTMWRMELNNFIGDLDECVMDEEALSVSDVEDLEKLIDEAWILSHRLKMTLRKIYRRVGASPNSAEWKAVSDLT